MNPTPLLSICIPTYERAHLLRVMLQALLPQAADVGDEVEVCIADNASTDNTAEIVAEAAAAFPQVSISYVRRDSNLGPSRNYVRSATEQARGHFVWAVGDDDLLLSGALKRVCNALRSHPEIEFFYTNFASADFHAHFPASAHGAYGGVITGLSCTYIHDRAVRHWQELLDSSSSLGTQSYAHIVARSVWQRYFAGREIARDHFTLDSTYPHTCMLIDTAWDKPAFYIGAPSLAVFDGRPGWGEGNATRILLVSLPLLIARLDDRGIGLHTLTRARAYLAETVLAGYRQVISGKGGPDAAEVAGLSLAIGDRYPEMIEAMLTAIGETGGSIVPGVIDVVAAGLTRVQQLRDAGVIANSAI